MQAIGFEVSQSHDTIAIASAFFTLNLFFLHNTIFVDWSRDMPCHTSSLVQVLCRLRWCARLLIPAISNVVQSRKCLSRLPLTASYHISPVHALPDRIAFLVNVHTFMQIFRTTESRPFLCTPHKIDHKIDHDQPLTVTASHHISPIHALSDEIAFLLHLLDDVMQSRHLHHTRFGPTERPGKGVRLDLLYVEFYTLLTHKHLHGKK